MTAKNQKDFGKRQPAQAAEAPARKRSNHIALLLMGTVALGGGAYALMPSEHCDPKPPGISAAVPGQPTECQQRSSSSSSSSSSGGHGSSARSNFASTDSASGSGTSHGSSTAGSVMRGGFGSFASHFSGGG